MDWFLRDRVCGVFLVRTMSCYLSIVETLLLRESDEAT